MLAVATNKQVDVYARFLGSLDVVAMNAGWTRRRNCVLDGEIEHKPSLKLACGVC
jgi:hypothetical protein